jgi:hypothetical protein
MIEIKADPEHFSYRDCACASIHPTELHACVLAWLRAV